MKLLQYKIKQTTSVEFITILFVILFLYSGTSKLMDYNTFEEQIATSPVLEPIAPFIASILPWTEFLAVLLLTIPRWRLRGIYLSLILMIVFTIYIIAILTISKDTPCSCGGIIDLLSWPEHIIFNGVFITIGLLGARLEKGIKQKTFRTLQGIISTIK